MMKCIVVFYENAKRVIIESQMTEKKVSWGLISVQLEDEFLELIRMKFINPLTPVDEMNQGFDRLCDSIENKFREIVHS
jgi:hypothetical protein